MVPPPLHPPPSGNLPTVVYKVRLHPPSGCQGMAGRKGLLLKYVKKIIQPYKTVQKTQKVC